MEYFAPGIRELQRIAARCVHRARLALARRQLAAAETELGLLGWQQADFDDETGRQVDEIQHVEREQGRLHNASAELAQAIRALHEERARVRSEHDAERARLDREREKIRDPLAELETRLAALRRHEHDFERRTPELDREQRELDKLYTELLLVQPQPPQVRDELHRVRDRLIAIPNEKADLRSQHVRIAADLDVKEAEAAEIAKRTSDVDRQLHDLNAAVEAADDRFATELREREKEKSRVVSDIEKLECAKRNPYREIGRVLADSGVAPVNQPNVLHRVRALRDAVQERETQIAASRQLTAQADPAQLRISLALVAILIIAAALIIGVLF